MEIKIHGKEEINALPSMRIAYANEVSEACNFEVEPEDWLPISSMIKVIGVGGGGCNAVSYMHSQGFSGCQFIACNTDQKALQRCEVPCQIKIGNGLGAGTRPEIARAAAMEAYDDITKTLVDDNTKMVFVTASLGGGTGTGAAPIVAGICKEAGVLTIGVVTLPFNTEGKTARLKALDGLDEMRTNVDSLIVIDNNRLYKHYGKLSISAAFHKVDEVLATAVSGIIDIIEKTGYINVDLNDVQTIMRDSGMALMGCGIGTGDTRVDDAIKAAIESPLLNNYDLKKATKVLVNLTTSNGDNGLTMDELEKLESAIETYLGITENYKKGIVFSDDPEYGDKVSVTIIATGVDMMGAVSDDYFREKISGNAAQGSDEHASGSGWDSRQGDLNQQNSIADINTAEDGRTVSETKTDKEGNEYTHIGTEPVSKTPSDTESNTSTIAWNKMKTGSAETDYESETKTETNTETRTVTDSFTHISDKIDEGTSIPEHRTFFRNMFGKIQDGVAKLYDDIDDTV